MRVLLKCSWDIISTEVLLRYYENAIRMLLMYYWNVVQALLCRDITRVLLKCY